MSTRIYCSISEVIRENSSFEERWKGPDEGLIKCWEVGRLKSIESPELGSRAKNGALPPSVWKGGVAKKIQKEVKYGPLNYLAYWQGLRGEDLDIDVLEEREIVCTETGVKVIFTADVKKCLGP